MVIPALTLIVRKGFSLVELLVVIAVIAIIAAIAIPNLANITGAASIAKNQRNAQAIASMASTAKAAGASEDLSTPTSAMYALQAGITLNFNGQTITFQIPPLSSTEAHDLTPYLTSVDPGGVVQYAPEGGNP